MVRRYRKRVEQDRRACECNSTLQITSIRGTMQVVIEVFSEYCPAIIIYKKY